MSVTIPLCSLCDFLSGLLLCFWLDDLLPPPLFAFIGAERLILQHCNQVLFIIWVGYMKLKPADDFELLKAKYMVVAENTPDIEKYAHRIYGKAAFSFLVFVCREPVQEFLLQGRG